MWFRITFMNNKLNVSFWKDVLLTERGSVWCVLLCYSMSPWHLWGNQTHMLLVYYHLWYEIALGDRISTLAERPSCPGTFLLSFGGCKHSLYFENMSDSILFCSLPLQWGISTTVHILTMSRYQLVNLGGTMGYALSRVRGADKTIRNRGHDSDWYAQRINLSSLEPLNFFLYLFSKNLVQCIYHRPWAFPF